MDLIPGGSDRLKGIDSATDAMRQRLFGLCFVFFSFLLYSFLFRLYVRPRKTRGLPEVFNCTVGFRSTFFVYSRR